MSNKELEIDNSLILARIEKVLQVRRELIDGTKYVCPDDEELREKYLKIDSLFVDVVKTESKKLLINNIEIKRNGLTASFKVNCLDDLGNVKEMVKENIDSVLDSLWMMEV